MSVAMDDTRQNARGQLSSLGELLFLQGTAFVSSAYESILGRSVDKQGLEHYLGFLERGESKVSIVRELARSEEGRNRFELRDLDSLSDEDFIDEVYRRVLGRDPETAGKRHYLHVLSHGGHRRDVVYEVIKSQESQNRNPGLFQFRRDLGIVLDNGKRERSLWSRLIDMFSVDRRVGNLTQQLDDLSIETNFQMTALLGRLNHSGTAIYMPTSAPRASNEPVGTPRIANASLPTSYADGDVPQTINQVLAKVRAEVAAM